MKLLLKNVLISVFYFIPYLSFAQNASQNYFKYWIYRDRLVENFVYPGFTGAGNYCPNINLYGNPGPLGMSIMTSSLDAGFNERLDQNGNTVLDMTLKPNVILDSNGNVTQVNGGFRTGDGLTHQGYYIGTLATEYRLLLSDNKPTDSTLTRLYYALETIDRLDDLSEYGPPNSPSPLRRGCFCLAQVETLPLASP